MIQMAERVVIAKASLASTMWNASEFSSAHILQSWPGVAPPIA